MFHESYLHQNVGDNCHIGSRLVGQFEEVDWQLQTKV